MRLFVCLFICISRLLDCSFSSSNPMRNEPISRREASEPVIYSWLIIELIRSLARSLVGRADIQVSGSNLLEHCGQFVEPSARKRAPGRLTAHTRSPRCCVMSLSWPLNDCCSLAKQRATRLRVARIDASSTFSPDRAAALAQRAASGPRSKRLHRDAG